MGTTVRECAGGALFLLVILGCHLATLDADPPKVPNGQGGIELIVEGPAKAHEARRYALTGTFAGNASDNYRIWGVQSPVYVRPLGWVLRAFGPSLDVVRLYGVAVSLLGTFLLCLLLAHRLRGWSLFVVLLLSAGSFYAFHYARAGLLEPQVNTLLIAAATCTVLSLRTNPAWIVAALFAWATAFLTKQSAIVFLPVLGVATLVVSWQAARRKDYWHASIPWITVAILGAVLGFYISTDAYRQTLSWNYSHAVQGTESMLRGPFDWWRELERFESVLDARRWKQAVLWVAPVAFPLALLQVLRIATRCVRREWPEPLEWVLSLWFLGSLAALFAIAHARGRFSMVLLPPAFALAALEVESWLRGAKGMWRVTVLVSLLAVFVTTHMVWHINWARHLTHQLRDGTERLAEVLGPEDVVVGRWAPVLTFGTRSESFYVKHHFNTDRESLAGLGVTHLLGGKDGFTGRILTRRFPRALGEAKQITTVDMLGRRLPLFELAAPLGRDIEAPP